MLTADIIICAGDGNGCAGQQSGIDRKRRGRRADVVIVLISCSYAVCPCREGFATCAERSGDCRIGIRPRRIRTCRESADARRRAV